MATKLGALNELFSPGLELTVPDRNGVQREYTIPLASAELGLWCRAITEARHRDDITEDDLPKLEGKASLEQRVLGTAYDEMMRDGVPDEYVKFAGATSFIWITMGEEQAALYWQAGGDPKALKQAENREQRRAAARAGGTSTAEATETRPPASSSGTRSRRNSRRNRGR